MDSFVFISTALLSFILLNVFMFCLLFRHRNILIGAMKYFFKCKIDDGYFVIQRGKKGYMKVKNRYECAEIIPVSWTWREYDDIAGFWYTHTETKKLIKETSSIILEDVWSMTKDGYLIECSGSVRVRIDDVQKMVGFDLPYKMSKLFQSSIEEIGKIYTLQEIQNIIDNSFTDDINKILSKNLINNIETLGCTIKRSFFQFKGGKVILFPKLLNKEKGMNLMIDLV
jgi:hypothetical protein